MRINVAELNPDLRLDLTGDEPWLSRIYQDFPLSLGAPAKLTGTLRFLLEESGNVHVSGEIRYVPALSCARCDQTIPWPMSFTLDQVYLPEEESDHPREKNLSRADLEAYYLEKGELDVEQLLNDTVQEGVPTQVIATTDDGSACRICMADLTSDRVYSAGDAEAASPFAVLKGLKISNPE